MSYIFACVPACCTQSGMIRRTGIPRQLAANPVARRRGWSCNLYRVAPTAPAAAANEVRSPVAQLAEQPAVNRQVFGSSPNGGAQPPRHKPQVSGLVFDHRAGPLIISLTSVSHGIGQGVTKGATG